MFPETDITETTTAEEDTTMGTSFLFDFEAGDFITIDGKISSATGLEAVKVWIKKVLNTEKFKFQIYKKEDDEEEYGVSLLDFANSSYTLDFKKIEIEREIKEALAKNTAISKVHSFVFEQNKRTLNCSFTVETIYGMTGGEITI